MTAMVRDEADLLADWLSFHQAQGVDHFLIVDHRSVDGTSEMLARFAAAGSVTVFSESRPRFEQGATMTRLARMACTQFAADWVINNDADEFWFAPQTVQSPNQPPGAVTLKSFLAAVPPNYSVVRATRTNLVALLPDPPPPAWRSLIYRQAEPTNFIGHPLSGKVCHRAHADTIVHDGNHSVDPMPIEAIWPGPPLEILHMAARRYSQFARKISLGAALQLSGPGKGGYAAKRELYRLYSLGRLPAWYASWAYDADRLRQALADGELVVDTRLCEAMRVLDQI